MKLILTGTTGHVGTSILRAALTDPSIGHIFSVTRRALPSSISSPKLTSIIHDDLTVWPDSILSQLEGATACIWTVGTTPRKGNGTLESYTRADVDCTRAAAEAFTRTLAKPLHERGGGQRFKFVYTSAVAAERDQGQSLWFIPAPRISKGMAEKALVKVQDENADVLDVYYARIGKTWAENTFIPEIIIWTSGVMNRADQLALAMIEVAKNGNEKKILTPRDLNQIEVDLRKK